MPATIPSLINRTCHLCKILTSHIVAEVKKGKPFKHTHSAIQRRKNRRSNRGNKGKFSKVPAGKVKTSKHPHIMLTCKVCKRKSNLVRPRCTRFEIRAS